MYHSKFYPIIAYDIMLNNFELLLLVFQLNITTKHAITYTAMKSQGVKGILKWKIKQYVVHVPQSLLTRSIIIVNDTLNPTRITKTNIIVRIMDSWVEKINGQKLI